MAPAKAAVESAEARFIERNPKSKSFHDQASNSLPGGNTRTPVWTSPFALRMERGFESNVWDVDGHKYTDFMGELAAGIYGHSHPIIREAMISAFDTVGLSLGSTIVQEQRYAELLCSRFGLDLVRFSNSGTEANIHAINGAKAFTGKNKVVVFGGAYHGSVLSFGDGRVAPQNWNKDDWVMGKYNDVQSARKVIEDTSDLAAVLVEGMQGVGGCILGHVDFLQQVQESAKRVGAVFILDEIMTSRLAPGGLQSLLGLKPDMTTMGKHLGGGFAFGALGGRADIMGVYDPRREGAVVHAGTFNNNTMTMSVGYAGLSRIFTPEVAAAFNAMGDKYRQKLQEVAKGTKCFFTGLGSFIAVHFADQNVDDLASVEDVEERWDLKDLFWFEMLEDGFWTTRRGVISLMLPTPESEMDRFVACVGRFLERHGSIVAL
ncbi:pyridoxal phosphate-dependent transferase [Thelonectria olida]|uniref:Pyridoxal phosphate-dependent transferase n=1 Tax=Thelonectria olida TaxID=1576542 RepID=A0A9P8VY34_9HYPO|nr:pyridoxal phosphate-dependent transferase [Thelonectria olida]